MSNIVSDGEDLLTPELIRRIGKVMNKTPLLLPIPSRFIKIGTKLLGKGEVGDRLRLWLGTWSGIVEKESAQWLRFYDSEKKLILLPEEAAQQQAELEKLRSQELEAFLVNRYREQFGELQ